MTANLFADHEPPPTGPYAGAPSTRLPSAPLASPRDPLTSHDAGEQHEASGRAATNRKFVLALVRENPGLTAVELHAAQGDLGVLTRHEFSRRLPELRGAGLVRNGEAKACSIAGTSQLTWYAN